MNGQTLQGLLEKYQVKMTVEELLLLALRRIRAEDKKQMGGDA